MIKCIAMDLDDTLLRDDLTISKENREAIDQARSKGIEIVLASGRMVKSMQPFAEKLGLTGALIAYNGAVVGEIETEKIIHSWSVSLDLARQVIIKVKEKGFHLNLYLNDTLYVEQMNPWVEYYMKIAGVTPQIIGDFLTFLQQDPHKLLAMGEREAVNPLKIALETELGENLDFVKSKPEFVEVLGKDISKGRALKTLAGAWGFTREEVMAIGDAPNDLSMITWAGTGVAVGNAWETVKQAADFVVGTNQENGVAEAIRQVVMQRGIA